MINSLKHRLQHLHNILDSNTTLVPEPDSLKFNKLGDGGLIITDTCNTAQKFHRIIVDMVEGTKEFDCMNHLRCVWFGNMEKALTKELNTLVKSDLDEIDPHLYVSTSISAILRAMYKEFSL